ncbi:MAG: cation:proton antiporter [Nannocystaceae bacterium]|nr:cation:proton antiporter [Myxococcales bacterium]
MDDLVALFLVVIASLLSVGALGELLFKRTRIPDAIWLIAAGLGLRLYGVVPEEVLHTITPYFAAVTLVIVLFEGGSRLSLADLVGAAPRATLMSVLGYVAAMFTVAVFTLAISAIGVLPEAWTFWHGLLTGAIVGGTSSLILTPALALTRVSPKITRIIQLEASLTDALCVVVSLALIGVMASEAQGAAVAATAVARSFGIAVGLGVLAGWAWVPVSRLLARNARIYPLTLAALFFVYVFAQHAGGSPPMAVLAFAVVVGNASLLMRWLIKGTPKGPELGASVRAVHSQISFIIKALFFTYMGLMLSPPWSLLIFGSILGVLLLLVRVPIVGLVLRGRDFGEDERGAARICMPRGMAAGALAMMPMIAGVPGTETLHTLVFATIAATIVVFTIGFRTSQGTWPLRPVGTAARAPAISGPDPDEVTATEAAERDLLDDDDDPHEELPRDLPLYLGAEAKRQDVSRDS